jgi:hypothetical protein
LNKFLVGIFGNDRLDQCSHEIAPGRLGLVDLELIGEIVLKAERRRKIRG